MGEGGYTYILAYIKKQNKIVKTATYVGQREQSGDKRKARFFFFIRFTLNCENI